MFLLTILKIFRSDSSSRTRSCQNNRITKQAGAELCQAQVKLEVVDEHEVKVNS